MHCSQALAVAAAALATAWLGAAQAQAGWPTMPIGLVVPFATGGTSAILARAVGDELAAALKQPVVVDNRAGAGGLIGADQRYRSAAGLVAAVKSKPGLPFASAGQGSSQHMSGAAFDLIAGIDLTHVPYRGSAPAITGLITGQVPMSFETATVALPHIHAGKARARAVTTATRSRVLPDVPTMQEAGVRGFDIARWQACCAPADTPPAIDARVNTGIARILAMPGVKARLESVGVEQQPNTPQQLADLGNAELATWSKIVKEGSVTL